MFTARQRACHLLRSMLGGWAIVMCCMGATVFPRFAAEPDVAAVRAYDATVRCCHGYPVRTADGFNCSDKAVEAGVAAQGRDSGVGHGYAEAYMTAVGDFYVGAAFSAGLSVLGVLLLLPATRYYSVLAAPVLIFIVGALGCFCTTLLYACRPIGRCVDANTALPAPSSKQWLHREYPRYFGYLGVPAACVLNLLAFELFMICFSMGHGRRLFGGGCNPREREQRQAPPSSAMRPVEVCVPTIGDGRDSSAARALA